MTNWDKFKDSITPELFGHLLDGRNGEESDPDECDGCPAECREFCKKCHAEEENEDYDHKDWSIVYKLCEERFVIWANTKAEGGMDYEALAKKSIEHLDKMTDEELNKDFRDYCGLTDEDFKEENPNETV